MIDSAAVRGAVVPRRVAIGGFASLFVAAGARRASAQGGGATITLGAAPNDSSGTLLYAADLGNFEKAGLNVQMTVLTNPAPMTAAVAGGSVTIAGVPITQAALAREKGLPIVMIAPLSLYLSSSPTNAIIVLKNSPLRKAADLNGKTVATRDLANMSYFGAKAWIDKNGGDSKTIKWVEISDTQDVAAMQAGRIDAASVSEPALDAALQGDARVLGSVFDAIASRFLVAGCFTSEAYAKAHPDVVRTFADVIESTSRWANANRAASGKILEKYAQAPVLPGSTRVTYAERIRAADVQPVLDLLLTYGLLKGPMRASELFSGVVPAS